MALSDITAILRDKFQFVQTTMSEENQINSVLDFASRQFRLNVKAARQHVAFLLNRQEIYGVMRGFELAYKALVVISPSKAEYSVCEADRMFLDIEQTGSDFFNSQLIKTGSLDLEEYMKSIDG